MTLKWLKISAGARLEVERGSGYTDLYLSDGVLQGQIELQEAELRIMHEGRPKFHTVSAPSPAETLSFTAPGEGSTRVWLRLKTSKDWRIDNLYINGMAFERELSPDTGNFVSSILKGTIEMPEIKSKVTLLENDWMRLVSANSTRLHLSFAAADQNGFNLFFSGSCPFSLSWPRRL